MDSEKICNCDNSCETEPKEIIIDMPGCSANAANNYYSI